MIRPEIKGEPYFQDMSELSSFKPNDPDNFSVVVEFGVGEAGREECDNYTVNVCTAKWLENDLNKNGKPIILKGTLLVDSYNPMEISTRIKEIINTISGKDWSECKLKLVGFFNWEFE